MRIRYEGNKLIIENDDEVLAKVEGEDIDEVELPANEFPRGELVGADDLSRAYDIGVRRGKEGAKIYAKAKQLFVKSYNDRHNIK
ncbi:hypothetical protein [Bacillus piscicola]|uniref:hypothetical protein n=1 Tax=Bacillus piscicola TaxID=1632684 RepID=UPI001F09AA19|nr:hypothetical protein [Bacillus piscicola]